jgi:hypothetical protein
MAIFKLTRHISEPSERKSTPLYFLWSFAGSVGGSQLLYIITDAELPLATFVSKSHFCEGPRLMTTLESQSIWCVDFLLPFCRDLDESEVI